VGVGAGVDFEPHPLRMIAISRMSKRLLNQAKRFLGWDEVMGHQIV